MEDTFSAATRRSGCAWSQRTDSSAHVGVLPLCEGDVRPLHGLRRRPPQDVVRTSRFVVRTCHTKQTALNVLWSHVVWSSLTFTSGKRPLVDKLRNMCNRR